MLQKINALIMPKAPKQPNKEDPEYLEKRKRNNEAIKKSREKAKEKAAKTQERVEFLKDDNKKMEDKIHKCEFCSYFTHRKSFMNDHVRVHTGEKPFW